MGLNIPVPSYRGTEPYVFVCYAHKDSEAVYADLSQLDKNGVHIWYDEGIAAGKSWRAEIATAIKACRRFIFFISESSINSVHCLREVDYALNHDIEVIPVYLEETSLPPELELVLNRVQALSRAKDPSYEQHLLYAIELDKRPPQPFANERQKNFSLPGSATALAGALVLTLALLLGNFYLSDGLLESGLAVEPNTIAVLPLLNIDRSERGEVFSKGLAEDVISHLSRIPNLRVAARQDSFSLPTNATSSEVRRRLRVSYYIEGSSQLVNDKIKVSIRLVETESGRQLQSRNFESDSADLFQLQEEITNLAVANLRLSLPDNASAFIGSAPRAGSFDAYLAYRYGVELLEEEAMRDGENFDKALGWFQRSLGTDSEYAAAHAGICRTFISKYINIDKDRDFIDTAEKACSDALNYDPKLSIVHNALGDLHQNQGQFADAEGSYLNSLAVNENDTVALIGLAQTYANQQKLDEAEQYYERAISSRPGNWQSYNSLGAYYYNNGRYVEAVSVFREVVDINPDVIKAWQNLGTALLYSGNFKEAEPAFKRSLQIQPTSIAYSNLGLMHYYLGNFEEAISALEQATTLAENDQMGWSNLGDALFVSGRKEEAIAAYREAEHRAMSQLRTNPSDRIALPNLPWIKLMLGKQDEAREIISKAETIFPEGPQIHYIHGLILAYTGEADKAVDEFRKALDEGYSPIMLEAEPLLEEFRKSPYYSGIEDLGVVD